jgi:class 3 adenylate cyclase
MCLTPTPEHPLGNITSGTILAHLAVFGGSKPVANLYLQTTVMFADISGFTAWSSVREPSQVFTLLEIVFREFDQLANSHGVFKVGTVGDCYVAVSGLPEPYEVCKRGR